MRTLKPIHDGFTEIVKRNVAFLIDLVLPFFIISLASSFLGAGVYASAILAWIGWTVYHVSSVRKYGQTLGWKIFGWKLLKNDKTKPSVAQLIIRLIIFTSTFTGIGTAIAVIYFFPTGNVFWWDGITKLDLFEEEKQKVPSNSSKMTKHLVSMVSGNTNKKSMWEKLTPTAKVVLIAMATLIVLVNLGQGNVGSAIGGFISIFIIIAVVGSPLAFIYSLFVKRTNLLSDAIIISGILLCIITLGLVYFVVNNLA